MTGSRDAQADDRAEVNEARAQFLESAPSRIQTLQEALSLLVQRPQSTRRRDNLVRRAHAMAAAARVLGFDRLAGALAEAERQLQSPDDRLDPEQLEHVGRLLAELPDLAAAPVSDVSGGQLDAAGGAAGAPALPASVLVFANEALVEPLRADQGQRLEIARAEDLPTARDLAAAVAPDVVVVDADLRGADDLIRTLVGTPTAEAVAVLAIASVSSPDAAAKYVQMGVARLLSKPVPPDTLRAAVTQLVQRRPSPQSREPVGVVNMRRLSARIAEEVNRGLVQALEPGCEDLEAALGEGTDILAAVWGAVARVRELVTVRSEGAIRFDSSGPEGSITLAPWISRERIAADRESGLAREADQIPLRGRRAVIADDDPAVVWFISGLLAGVGMEVHEAHDGQQAFELASTLWPDIVISDVLMPRRDGFTLCRDLKRDVAVRDVPVILLSWKEDLLRRARELGADADGYLSKEASASVVVQRVREVLRPRARIESRLARGGEVRGRVDGITTRLLLQLACASPRNVTLTVRDAVFVYVVEIRDGQLRCATRTAADGSYLRGADVLAGLLGVGSGRFVVAASDAPCHSEFEGELEQLLAPPVRAARAAQHALAEEALRKVTKVEFDPNAVAAYVALSPPIARRLAERLVAGASPQTLLQQEHVSSRLLEAVLADLARHGGVRAVYGEEGQDLLAAFDTEAARVDQHLQLPPEILTPSPWFTFQLSAKPPAVAAAVPIVGALPDADREVAAEPVGEAAELSPQARTAEPPPVEPTEAPERPSLLDGGWEARRARGAPSAPPPGDRATLPGMGKDAAVALAAAALGVRPEPSQDAALESAAAPDAADSGITEARPKPEGTGAPSAVGVPSAPQESPPPPQPRAEEAAAAVLQAVVETGAPVPASGMQEVSTQPETSQDVAPPVSEPAPEPALAAAAPVLAAAEQPVVVRKIAPPARVADAGSSAAPQQIAQPSTGAGELPVSDELASVARAAFAAGAKRAEPLPVEPQAAAAAGSSDQRGDAQDAAESPTPAAQRMSPEAEASSAPAPGDSQAPAARQGSEGTLVSEAPPTVAETDEAESLDRTLVSDAPSAAEQEQPSSSSEEETPAELATGRGAAGQADEAAVAGAPPGGGAVHEAPLPPVTKQISFPGKAAQSRSDSEGTPGEESGADRPAARQQPEPKPAGQASPLQGAVATGAITLLAAAVTFTAVRWWVGGGQPEVDAEGQTPATSAEPAGAPSLLAAPAPASSQQKPSKAAGAQPEIRVEDLTLPPGIAVAEGKGLLEVDTGGRHAIYVGGAFVGRGPIRRVELDPGSHQVRVRLDAEQLEHTVTILKGRRARLALSKGP